jgi:oxygen-independent coproporphyrinogen-3 oxidase
LRGRAYIGFGPSAPGSDGVSRRSWNASALGDYLLAVESGRLPEEGSELLSHEQLLLERIMLGLRTSDGVDLALAGFDGRPPEVIRNMISNWASNGLCSLDGLRIRPSSQGMLMADGMASSLAAVLDL